MSFAKSFILLVILRLIYGIFESTFGPISYGLIGDIFHHYTSSTRTLATSLFGLGVYIAVGIASFLLSIDQSAGWRTLFLWIGVAGCASSILLLFVTNPQHRSNSPTTSSSSFQRATSQNSEIQEQQSGRCHEFLNKIYLSAKFILHNEVIRVVTIAFIFRFMGGICLGTFYATFMTKYYSHQISLFSYLNTANVAVFGMLSTLTAGVLASKCQKRYTGARGLIVGVSTLLSLPFQAVAFSWNPSFGVSVGAYTFQQFFSECFSGPIYSIILETVPSQLISMAIALQTICYVILSDGIVIGMGKTIDYLQGDKHPQIIGYMLNIFVSPLYCAAGISFLAVSCKVRKSKMQEFEALQEEEPGPMK